MAAEVHDEGDPMTALALLAVSAFLLSCGVRADELGDAWIVLRSLQHDAEHPSDMGPLAEQMRAFARARDIDRARAAAGLVGRHTGPIPTS